jgi:FkbM family methyltransferase
MIMNTPAKTTGRTYYSQGGEDILLWQLFDTQQKPGVFVEVGALDGIRYSNTYSFEQAGWTGICVEAHPDYIEIVRKNRPHSTVVFAAAGNEDKTVTFHTNKRGSLSSLDSSLKDYFETYGEYFTGFEPVEVAMKRLDTILADANIQSPIDILSVDVEGAELLVLQGLDIERYQPRVIVLEAINAEKLAECDQHLASFGYQNARRVSSNSFYARDARDIAILREASIKGELLIYPHPLDGDQTIQRRSLTGASHTSVKQPSLASSVKRLLKQVRKRLFPAQSPTRELSPTFDLGFHGDRYLLDFVHPLLQRAEYFLETGANVGTTLAYVGKNYPHLTLYSCEPDVNAYAATKRHVHSLNNVHLYNELSPEFLYARHKEYPQLTTSRNFYWLDAHSYGYKWPLHDEIEFITRTNTTAVIAIDDTQIPGRPEFKYIIDGDQICNSDYIIDALAPGKRYKIVYPTYTEHTSAHHPLVGVMFVVVGSDFLLPESIPHFQINTLDK